MNARESSQADLKDFERRVQSALSTTEAIRVHGRIVEVLGNIVRTVGIQCQVGELCELRMGQNAIGYAEVIGFSDKTTYLSPLGNISHLSPRVSVIPLGRAHEIPVGEGLLGRIVNGFGATIDARAAPDRVSMAPIDNNPPNPISRTAINKPFETGLAVIDTLLSCGVGQRVGVFAPAGAGKSTLLGNLARNAKADINVIALIGERGRELGDFLRNNLDSKTLERTVIVVTTSDRSAMERVRAAQVATTIAEHFREKGKHVLLLMDSLTRLARAQREIGLAIGEPPTRRGYPPSVFTMLPRLLERTGTSENGAITAFYTILTEGEENDDPVAEEVRAILDGHLILSRTLAAANHHPAIDLLQSSSRVSQQVTTKEEQALADKARLAIANYQEVKLLVQIGEYQSGANSQTDEAVRLDPLLREFTRQTGDKAPISRVKAFKALSSLMQSPPTEKAED